MKTTDLGKYVLENLSDPKKNLELKKNTNIIVCQGNDFLEKVEGLSISIYDAAFYIQILEECIEIVNMYKNDGKTQDIQRVSTNDIINLNNMDFSINYKCIDDNLEKAIIAFKNNNLVGPFSLKKLLLDYAEMLKISDKLAVSIIITTIDIPEIEAI